MLVNSSDRIMRSYSMEYDPQDTEPDLELDGKFMEGVDKTQWLDCCFSADGEYVVAGTHMTPSSFLLTCVCV